LKQCVIDDETVLLDSDIYQYHKWGNSYVVKMNQTAQNLDIENINACLNNVDTYIHTYYNIYIFTEMFS